jgi:hypothetical protein
MASRLAEKIPAAEVEQFKLDMYGAGITEADIIRIHDLGYNVVRIPINHLLLEDDDDPYVYKQSGWDVLDSILGWCAEHDVYAVLDLHSAPGGQSTLFVADPDDGNQAKLWDNTTNNKDRTIELWRAIADRYADNTSVAGYDLLNEPSPPANADLIDLYGDIITAIREVDTNHMVIIEGKGAALDFTIFSSALDANQMYEFHQYTWFNEDRGAQLNDFHLASNEEQVPMWNGEFGENNYAMVDSTVAMYEDTANNFSGWALWTWKKVPKAGGSPALEAITKPATWQPVLDWLDHTGANPTATQIRDGLADFLDAVSYANLTEDDDLVNALLPDGEPGGGPAWKNATANWADGWCGGNGWESSPANAYADGGGYASNVNGVSQCHQYYNYNFGVPANATIDGVEAILDSWADSASGGPELSVQISWNTGWSWSEWETIPTLGTSQGRTIIGWPTNTWNHTWVPNDFTNGNFRIKVKANCVTTGCSARDYYVDWIPVRVFYHVP